MKKEDKSEGFLPYNGVYLCRRCGSVLIENVDAERNDDFQPLCPFCDVDEDRNVAKLRWTSYASSNNIQRMLNNVAVEIEGLEGEFEDRG